MRDFRTILSIEHGIQTDGKSLAAGQQQLEEVRKEIKRRTGRK